MYVWKCSFKCVMCVCVMWGARELRDRESGLVRARQVNSIDLHVCKHVFVAVGVSYSRLIFNRIRERA